MPFPTNHARLGIISLHVLLVFTAGCQQSATTPPAETSLDSATKAIRKPTHSAASQAEARTTNSSPTAPVSDEPPADVLARFQPIRNRLQKTQQLNSEDVATLEELARQAPRYAPISNLLARIYVQREDWNGLATLMKAQPPEQWNEAHRIQLANVMIRAQRFREAYETVQPLVTATGETDAEAAWNAGYAAFHLGELATAQEVLSTHLDAIVAADHLDAYLLLADIQFRDGNLDQATKLLTSLLERDEFHAPGHDLLGRILSVGGNNEEAQRHIREAAAIRAKNTEAQQRALRLAAASQALNAAWERKDYKACEAFIREMLPQVNRQQQTELWKYVAAIRRAQGRPEEAERALKKAAQLTESP